MLDIHITEFYNDAGRIFSKLYGQFPRQITLWTDDISGPDTADEYGMHSERYLACYSTIIWLQEEGYLRFSDIDKSDAFNNCVLSGKGYQAVTGIKQISVQESRPIDVIRLALHEQSSNLMEDAVNTILINS